MVLISVVLISIKVATIVAIYRASQKQGDIQMGPQSKDSCICIFPSVYWKARPGASILITLSPGTIFDCTLDKTQAV